MQRHQRWISQHTCGLWRCQLPQLLLQQATQVHKFELFLCAEMGYHCKVFDTYEFRTSRLCCAALDGMPLPVTGNPSPHQRADMQTPHKPMLHMLQGLYTKHIFELHTQYLTSQPTNRFG